jgi:transcriptional regulator with XRE-family HTH domain
VFFEQLSELCGKNGISLTSFVVDQLKMSKSNVTKWKDGVPPKSDTVLKIAQYFHVTTDYLLTGNKSILLSEDENKLLEKYNNFTERAKGRLWEKIDEMSKDTENLACATSVETA